MCVDVHLTCCLSVGQGGDMYRLLLVPLCHEHKRIGGT